MNFQRIVRLCGLLLLAYCLFPVSLFSQTGAPARFEADFDVLAIPRGGYGVRVAYQKEHLRLSATTFDHRRAALVIAERNVNVRTSGVGFGVDYFLRPSRGIFFGVQTAFHDEELLRVTTEDRAAQRTIQAGVQAGYRWASGREEENLRGLFLEATVGLSTRLAEQPLTLGTTDYENQALMLEPGLRIGYRF